MPQFNGIPVDEGRTGGVFGGVPADAPAPSRSVADIVGGGISAIARDVTEGRAAQRQRERAAAIERAQAAGAQILEDSQAGGTAAELERTAAARSAAQAARSNVVGAGIDAARDMAIGGAQGVIGLGESAVGIGDLVTGWTGHTPGQALRDVAGYDPAAAKAALGALKSDAGKARDALYDSTKGFTDTLLLLGTNPGVLADKIVESLPGTIGAGAAGGKAVQLAMPRILARAEALGLAGAVAEDYIAATAAKVAVAASAGAEGLQQAGNLSETARQGGRAWRDYALPAIASGVGTAAIAGASGGVARKIGIGDIEADIAMRGVRGAGVKTGPAFWVNRAAAEGVKEGVLEEMPQSIQEAAWENVAMGRPWNQGLGKAAATGLATGAGMGGGHAAVTRPESAPPAGGAGPAFAGVPVDDGGGIPAADVLGTPEPQRTTEPTEAEKALFTPKSLTALDRVTQIDATLAATDTAPADAEALRAERDRITADWPKAIPGAPTTFSTEAGARLGAEYALMDAGDLVTSHDESLRPVPTYPQELQPRERERHASELQVQQIVQRLDPARLGESADAATGAPIVGADGLVESGNARTIALKRVYQANGLKAENYRQFLRDNAARFGLAPEDVDAVSRPVLVRVRTTPVNRAEFARQANAATVARMSPSEQARADAAMVDNLEDLQPDEQGDFMSGNSRGFVRRFLAKLPTTEQAGLIDQAGNLSQAGYSRIRNAVLAKAYGDSPVLLRMVESLDDNTRNLSKALMRVAPQVAKTREAIEAGALFDADITPDLMAAVEELSAIRERGTSVREALAQSGIFEDKLTPEGRELLSFLDENIRSPRRIADFIQAYLEALTAAGNPQQGSVFGDTAAPAKGDIITAAARTTHGEANAATRSADAGDANPAQEGGSQPEGTTGSDAGNAGDARSAGDAGAAPDWVAFPPDTGALEIHREFMDRLDAGEATIDEFKMRFASAMKSRDALADEFRKMTKDAIMKAAHLGYQYKNDPKDRLVGAAVDRVIEDFDLRESRTWTYGEGRFDRLIQFVESATQETLDTYAAKRKVRIAEFAEERQRRADGIQNPQTLGEFRDFIQHHKNDGKTFSEARMQLTPEQRARFDALTATESRDGRQARADQQRPAVRAAETTTEGQIVETKHTKTGEPLFVVKAAERVERDVYNQWNATAKRLGGRYSSYRGGGAVPGFQFKTMESARAFMKYLGGDTAEAQANVEARRDAFADDRNQSAVERLREMAGRLDGQADESLGQERKANTARRARFAAAAEASANADKAMAQTMHNIAQAIESGGAKFLDRVRQKVQIEMLGGFVRAAQYAKLRALYPSYGEQQKHAGEAPNAETADHAEFPNYTAFRSDLAKLGRQLLEHAGSKKLGQKLLSVADDVTEAYLEFAKANLHTVSTFKRGDGGVAAFKSREDAETAIARSGYNGKAIVLPFKRGQNIIIQSPTFARENGLWHGDDDKRITLTPEIGAEIVAKAKELGKQIDMPYTFAYVAEKQARLKAMGIETPAEFRAMLREFIGMNQAPKAPDRVKELERAMAGKRNADGLDFFPTPADTVRAMLDAAELKEGMSALEPSAGTGHIAELIREEGVEPDVVELSGERRELLEAKGFNLVGNDFMAIAPRDFMTFGDVFRAPDGTVGIMRGSNGLGGNRVSLVSEQGENLGFFDRDTLEAVEKRGTDSGYDRILMNPPFGDRRDALHVQHAYSLLRPGGRLVAIMGEGVFFGQDKKAQAFREWLDSVSGMSEKLENGTFNDPSLPVNTGVSARMVVIDKPAGAERQSLPASLSRSGDDAAGPATAISKQDANAVIDNVRAAFGPKARFTLHLIDSFDALPVQAQQDARDQGGHEGNTKGLIHRDGSIWVIRGNHSSAVDLEETILHELRGHLGTRKLFGTKLVTQLNNLFNRLGGWGGLKTIAARYGEADAIEGYRKSLFEPGHAPDWDFEVKVAVLTDELLARIAQQRPTLRQKLNEAVGAIRHWLREHGFARLAEYGETDIAYLIHRAGQALENPETPAGYTLLMTAHHGSPHKFDDADVEITSHLSRLNQSRPDTGRRIHMEDLTAVAQAFRAAFPGLPVHALETERQAPKELLKWIGEQNARGDWSAALHKGEVYLLRAGLMDAEHAMETAIHEAEHAGLERMFGQQIDTAMLGIYHGNPEVRAKADALMQHYRYSAVRATNEVLADMGPQATKLRGWRRLWAAVRNVLRGFKFRGTSLVSGWTDDDVTALVLRAIAAARRPADTRVSTGTWTALARLTGFDTDSGAIVADFKNDQLLKAHADYKAAKAGDVAAAARLVQALVKPASIEAARKGFGDDVIYVPVHAEEASGRNNIPNALALHYSAETGATVDDGIVQSNRAYHTGANAMERLLARAEFSGKVEPGRRYVLVDDVTTMGSTLADLASYIRRQGGEVAGSVVLVNAARGGIMTPASKTINELEARHGDEIRTLFDIDPGALTWSEAQYLLGFRTTDELRNRVAKAGQERLARLRAKGLLSEGQDSPGDVTRLSRIGQADITPTVAQRADAIIQSPAATVRPLDASVRGVTQAVRLDKLTGAAYEKAAALLDRYTPEQIKAGLVSDYGIPEAVLDQRARMEARQRQQLRGAGALLEKLSTLTRAESRVAYEWMNASDPQASDHLMAQLPPESVKTLADVEKAIDDLSREAVRLGQLSEDAYARNRFAYLHRSYIKHTAELTQGEAKARSRAIAILGNQYRGRGMTDGVDMAKVKNVAPEWWNRKLRAGQADKQLRGEKFIRLERRAPAGEGTTTLPSFGDKGRGRLREVIYWPAAEAIPARYAAWDQAGTWEARDTKGAKLILWRDFTKQEREALGEIDEVRYAVAKTLHGMIHDVETGRYLEWLAQRYAKKEGEEIDGQVVEASERMRDVFRPGEWVKVPDSTVPGTQVKRYGVLAGRYLPGPIWNDVRQTVGQRYAPFGEGYSAILRAWKTSKTALSPAVHMNNVMANFVMADWHDVTAGHVLKALKLMTSKDAAAQEVMSRYGESGGMIGTWAAKELQQEQLRPLLEAIERELGVAVGTSGEVGVMAALQLALRGRFPSAWAAFKPGKTGQAATKAARAMIDLYEAEDQVFRLAAWLKAKEEGASDLDAGKVARKSFLNYRINAPWVQMLRSTAFPFIAFTYRAVPMLLETAAKKPWKLLKLGLVAGAANALGYLLSGGNEDDERKLLPEEKAGRIWGLTPKLVRMPWNDANGSPVFLDVRRWIPVGDIFDTGQSHAAVPVLPAMVPGGPLAVLAELALNKQQFTGKEIALETDTPVERASKVAEYLYQAFAPNLLILPGTYAWEGAVNAGSGRTDSFGREQSLAQAVVSSVGIKVGSYPKDVLQLNAQREAMAKVGEIDRNIAALRREFQKHGMTSDEFQRKAGDQIEKKRKVLADLQGRIAGR